MLTPRGWSLLGAAIGLYAGSRILGLVQLAVLAAAAALLLAGGWWWARTRSVELRATRHLAERLQVGVDGRVDLEVTATGGAPTPTVAIADAFDRGRRLARLLLPPLPPGAVARAAYRIPTERRGRYEIGPLRASISDPFGVVRRTVHLLGPEEVLVYPRVHDVVAPPHGGGEDVDRDARQVRGRPDPAGDFLTLRAYAPGDDLRHVHWRSTARLDELMVRQGELRRRAPARVVLDARPGAHDRASFEVAVEACASIVTALERDRRPVQVLTSAGQLLGHAGQRHLASVLDELAVVETRGADTFAALRSSRRAPLLVVVAGRLRADDVAALGMLVRRGGLLVVVATRAESSLALRARPDLLVVPVTSHESFADAWTDAVVRWQHNVLRSRLAGSSPR
ncbi:MAG TPA: DUF58 domain-containing protein [Acidimicrobiia bacterium]|nr:DUF58 domain-containing protein [Acidimicrobiia bacterium]